MVTILDPGGTPTPTYNRAGTTIQTITAGASPGNSGSGYGNVGTPIVRYSERTVITIPTAGFSGSTWNENVTLPSDAEIGDVVEVYAQPGSIFIFPAIGDSIRGFPASNGTNSASGLSAFNAILRKTAASNWQAVAV